MSGALLGAELRLPMPIQPILPTPRLILLCVVAMCKYMYLNVDGDLVGINDLPLSAHIARR